LKIGPNLPKLLLNIKRHTFLGHSVYTPVYTGVHGYGICNERFDKIGVLYCTDGNSVGLLRARH